MTLLRIGGFVLNTDRVERYDLEVEREVEVVFFRSNGRPTGDDNTVTFYDDDAKYLRRWLERNSEDVYPRP